jgi:hypothetical protein
MSTRLFVMFLIFGVVACTPDPKPPQPVTRDALVGTWRHDRPNKEIYEIMLFESGIVAFIHAGEKLPIGNAFGRWSFDEGTLDLHMLGPDEVTFPLANRLIVQFVDGKLAFDIMGERTTWSPHDRYGASRDGAEDRRANDERGWAWQVEQAEKTAASGEL